MRLIATEKEIENAILQYLRNKPGCFAFKVNTTGIFDPKIKTFRRTSRYIVPGTPDIIVCYNIKGMGIFLGLEVKSQKGKQSKAQAIFEKSLKLKSGGLYFVVKSVKEVEDALAGVTRQLSNLIDSQSAAFSDTQSVISA